MRAVNADDLIHELNKDGIVEHGYVSVFGIPIIENCVAVVRCKDCKHISCSKRTLEFKKPSGVCGYWEDYTELDGFCSYGEKVTE